MRNMAALTVCVACMDLGLNTKQDLVIYLFLTLFFKG